MLARLLTLGRHSLIYGLGSVVSRLVAIVFTPIYTRFLHTAGYGDLGLLTTGAGLLTLLLTLGLDNATLYYFYRDDSTAVRRVIVSSWMMFVLALSFAVCAVLWWLALPLSWLLLHRAQPELIRLSLLGVPPSLVIAIMLETLRLNVRPWRYAALSIVNLLLTVGLNLLFVVKLRQGVPGILIASALGMSCVALLGLALTRTFYALTFSPRRLKAMLRYGLPLVPAAAAYWAINLFGNVSLVYARNNSIVGVYQGATKLSQALWLVIVAFGVAWGPFAHSIVSQADARRTYATVLTYYATAMCGLALVLSLFGREILAIFTTPAFVPGYQIVGMLALASVCNGAGMIVGIGAALAEKTPHVAWTALVAAALTIACNVILAPHFGIFGAAASTLVGNASSTLLLYRVSQRYYAIPYDGRRVLAIVLAFGALALAGLYADHAFPPGAPLVALKLGLALAYGALMVLAVLSRADIAAARKVLRAVGVARGIAPGANSE